MSALNCPNCGRLPQLFEDFKYAWDEPRTERSIILLRYQCRRWLGLRLCFGMKEWHWIEKDWYDVGHREALRKWNEAATAATPPPSPSDPREPPASGQSGSKE
jgi:hypothetical protein